MKINLHEHVGIRLINEQLEVVRYYDGTFRNVYDHVIGKVQTSLEDPYNSNYPFLTSIDVYGSTFFNWYQVLKFINELEQLANDDQDTEFKDEVKKVNEFLSTVSSLHFIQLVGD